MQLILSVLLFLQSYKCTGTDEDNDPAIPIGNKQEVNLAF